MSRRIEFRIDNNLKILLNFDDYGAILYYAYTLNQNLALQLYKAMVSEYYYKLGANIPLEEVTETDINAYLSTNNLPEVNTFINNQILPSLQTLPINLDLTTTWNIGISFEAFLMQQGSFFNYFNIDDIEQDGFTVKYFIDVFIQLREFFEEVTTKNTTYTISIN
ncbi:hypothetical protein [Flavobacterium piscisymbiosum]|uniref:Uncharacterized protein n=1 Tax=Flavobacterium piscisymbiosum TaxID=2893753 RepID=A0ABS8MNZ7_9FLAO|nr:hypothetical protein [Flavobacterium sp. F-30]MCC9066380.1 hypothetical protein [Flavobacterium sp. F-30]